MAVAACLDFFVDQKSDAAEEQNRTGEISPQRSEWHPRGSEFGERDAGGRVRMEKVFDSEEDNDEGKPAACDVGEGRLLEQVSGEGQAACGKGGVSQHDGPEEVALSIRDYVGDVNGGYEEEDHDGQQQR